MEIEKKISNNDDKNELGFKSVEIVDAYEINDFLFIEFNTNQKILIKEKELYDISNYDSISKIINMNGKSCAVLKRWLYTCLVDLESMSVLYESKDVYSIWEIDDLVIGIMGTQNNNTLLYNTKTKSYIPTPENYEYEINLKNNLYVFSKKSDSEFYDSKEFYTKERCVIDAQGKVLLSAIKGWIDLCDNHLIITDDKGLKVLTFKRDSTVDIKAFSKDDELLSKPCFNQNKLFIIKKNAVELYSPNLKLIKKITIDGMDKVVDYEITGDILKLCLPYTINGKQTNKHVFINIKTGKVISHIRIEVFPYWRPKVFIGRDSLVENNTYFKDQEYEKINYHIYDGDFNKMLELKSHDFSWVDEEDGNLISFITFENDHFKTQYFNLLTNEVKDLDYETIKYPNANEYGYAFNSSTFMLDILDRNLNIVIPNIDYKKFGIKKHNDNISFFVVNDYVCINNYFTNDYGGTTRRTFIQSSRGDVVFDTYNSKCYPIGNFIHIESPDGTMFLNTLTGELGSLEILAKTDDSGKIDFDNVNINDILSIGNDPRLSLTSGEEGISKVKKNNKK